MAGSDISREPLQEEDIQRALSRLDGWSYDKDRLEKTFRFGGFTEAMSFMVRIGFEAEAMDHHPELFNVYNTVRVGLSTHDAGNRVTGLDVELARRIDHIAWV